jgi:8-oxo-dGTP diphosphatase
MGISDAQAEPKIIRAAGGLVWRRSSKKLLLAVIRRTRYGTEWTLPKGKLRRRELWLEAAEREVREETGCAKVRIGTLAGCNAYLVKDRPKLVLYWNMRLIKAGEFVPSEEVKELVWVTVSRALQLLTHEDEKSLLHKPVRKRLRSL